MQEVRSRLHFQVCFRGAPPAMAGATLGGILAASGCSRSGVFLPLSPIVATQKINATSKQNTKVLRDMKAAAYPNAGE